MKNLKSIALALVVVLTTSAVSAQSKNQHHYKYYRMGREKSDWTTQWDSKLQRRSINF